MDEVGELPLDTQVKLLRVLQQKEVEPVGAAKPVHVNVRVLSATNRDLLEEVRNGRFREDLYFRLNVLELHLPPLRERIEDIIPLANHFIERYCVRHGFIIKTLSDEALNFMKSYGWPGNVRQLENMMQRAIVMGDGQVIDVHDLSRQPNAYTVPHEVNAANAHTGASKSDSNFTLSLSLVDNRNVFKPIEDIEQEVMQRALQYYGNNITKAAEALGMAKSTFYRKMKPTDL